MTETANTATQPGSKNTAEPSEPTREQLLEGLDDFAKTTLERMEGWAQEYNNNDVTISAAKGDVQGLLQKLRETSSNPEVKEITKQIERIDDARFALDQKRDELLKPEADKLKAEATANSSSLEESNKDLKSKFNTARKFFADLVEDENVIGALVPKLSGSTRGPSAGTGTGVRRIRKRDWKIEQGEAVKVFDNASAAAKFVSLDTATFQELFFTAAGSDDASKWADSVSFTVPVEDGVDYSVESRNTEGAKTAPVVEEAAATEAANTTPSVAPNATPGAEGGESEGF